MHKLILFFALIIAYSSNAGEQTISGRITEEITGQAIQNVRLMVRLSRVQQPFYAFTDSLGYYSIKLPGKVNIFEVSHPDFIEQVWVFNETSETITFNCALVRRKVSLQRPLPRD